MKRFFIVIIPLLAIISSTSSSCTKEKPYMNDGIITGFDQRACSCCGGLMINFKGETQSYKGEFHLIRNNPSELGINNSSTFPIYIKVDWIQEGIGCAGGANGGIIKITRFKKQ